MHQNIFFFLQKTGYKFKRVEIDVAIVQRIHKLFKVIVFV